MNTKTRCIALCLLLSSCANTTNVGPVDQSGPIAKLREQAGSCADRALKISPENNVATHVAIRASEISRFVAKGDEFAAYNAQEDIDLPAVSIPQDGLDKGKSWRACMKRAGYDLDGARMDG